MIVVTKSKQTTCVHFSLIKEVIFSEIMLIEQSSMLKNIHIVIIHTDKLPLCQVIVINLGTETNTCIFSNNFTRVLINIFRNRINTSLLLTNITRVQRITWVFISLTINCKALSIQW